MKTVYICITICLLISAEASADVWLTDDVDVITGDLFYSPSIAIEVGDILHIAYQQRIPNSSSELKYAHQSGSSWSITTVDSNSSSHKLAENLSLALDAGGYPCIAYSDNTSESSLKYTSWTGSNWTMEVVNSGTGYGQVSLCLRNGDNQPNIAYSSGYGSSDHDLMYACFDNQWLVSPVDTTGQMGLFVSMDLANDNTPHISYCDFTLCNLKYAFLGPEFWHIFTIDSSTVVGYHNSIALDSNDNPHISYFDFYNGDLKYSYYTGSTWLTETVDSAGETGNYGTSLALDSNDHPHISYYHLTHDELMHAYYNGTSWEISVVDSDEEAGTYSSIALDSNDIPHIAYTVSDGDNNFIRHAYYGSEGTEDEDLSETVSLHIYPNPCSGSATVSFNLPVSDHVILDLYDVSGRKVAAIADDAFTAAVHDLTISDLTTGIYICILNSGEFTTTRRLVVIK